jgi:hypothetical protein
MESADFPELVPESSNAIGSDIISGKVSSPGYTAGISEITPGQLEQSTDITSGQTYNIAPEVFPSYCNPNYRMPDIIEVKVNINDDMYFFPVTVVKAVLGSKSYLGGYKSKLSGLRYHHAATQVISPLDSPSKLTCFTAVYIFSDFYNFFAL